MIGEGRLIGKVKLLRSKKDNYSGYYVIEPHFGHRIHSTYNHIESFRKILNEKN